MKDFYRILEVSPMSTREEIKRQYRKLAKQYHPDATDNDPYALARFQDIKEAYETLTQPAKKEAWLKERWLRQVYHAGPGETQPLTPFSILEKVLKYERQVAAMDIFRMDHHGVVRAVQNLLNPEHRQCLATFNEPDMNRTIIQHLLLALRPIPYPHTLPALAIMEELAGKDIEARRMLRAFRTGHRRKQRRDAWTLPLVILATLLICAIIFLGGRH